MSTGGWLALDVGGANLKAAHEAGMVASRRFALWREPSGMERELRSLGATFPPFDKVALAMTAELCDCFETKAEGVRSVVDAVVSAFEGRSTRVWTTDGDLCGPSYVSIRPLSAAASNWLALAEVAARLMPEGPGLVLDIGSTTADLIPTRDGRVATASRTDADRLAAGELVYLGTRRTPICALATSIPHRGRRVGLMAELFATTLDVYLTLGAVADDPSDLDTADGRPATASAARDRLSRMVGADREAFDAEDALDMSRHLDGLIVDRLGSAAGGRRLAGVVVSGSGRHLALRVARRLVDAHRVIDLADLWGPEAADAACASALLRLAVERGAEG